MQTLLLASYDFKVSSRAASEFQVRIVHAGMVSEIDVTKLHLVLAYPSVVLVWLSEFQFSNSYLSVIKVKRILI